jgi:outer membrane protein assembly factor BamB
MYGSCDPDLQCNRSLREQIAARLPSGGFLFGSPMGGPEYGTRGSLDLLNIDKNGNLLWATTYAQQAVLYGLAVDKDGGFFVVGADFAYGPPTPGFILRCDSKGAILWDKLYVNALNWAGAFTTRDGGLLVVDNFSRLTKFNAASGAILWDWGYFRASEPTAIVSTSAAVEVPDGGIVFFAAPRTEGALLLKVDEDGGIQWCRRYPELSPRQTGFQWLQATPDGGILLTATLNTSDYAPVLVWLDGQGNVIRAKSLRGVGDISLWKVGLFGAIQLADGSTVAIGGGSDFTCQSVCNLQHLLKLDSQGEVLWSRGWSYPTPIDGGVDGLFPASDKIEIAGYGDDFGENYTSESLLRLDGQGHGLGSCRTEKSDLLAVADAQVTSLPVLDMERSTYPYVYAVDAHHVPFPVTDIPDHLLCGAKYPGIASIKKLQNPLRLKLSGRNFEQDSVILINGLPAPKSSFVRPNKQGIATIVAKGSRLKAMLPKGQSVTITVINPDGRESVGYVFVR